MTFTLVMLCLLQADPERSIEDQRALLQDELKEARNAELSGAWYLAGVLPLASGPIAVVVALFADAIIREGCGTFTIGICGTPPWRDPVIGAGIAAAVIGAAITIAVTIRRAPDVRRISQVQARIDALDARERERERELMRPEVRDLEDQKPRLGWPMAAMTVGLAGLVYGGALAGGSWSQFGATGARVGSVALMAFGASSAGFGAWWLALRIREIRAIDRQIDALPPEQPSEPPQILQNHALPPAPVFFAWAWSL